MTEEEKRIIKEKIDDVRKKLDLYKAIELHSYAVGHEVSIKELAKEYENALKTEKPYIAMAMPSILPDPNLYLTLKS